MMKPVVSLIALIFCSPAMACSDALDSALQQPVGQKGELEFDAKERMSVEGGEWKLWLGADGKAREIVRIDYGESGRLMTRLVVDSARDYAVTATTYSYSAPIYVLNSSPVREEKDIYLYCDGTLLVPDDELFGVDEAYAAAAGAALAVFNASEIADYLPKLKR